MSRPTQHDTQDQAVIAAAREVYEGHLRVAAGALAEAIRGGVTDGAETISHLLATVAANLGGMHTLTAARPGSWEAHYVDQFLASTVGSDGDYLLEYRTTPIEVVECLEVAMADVDIAWLYGESHALIDAAEAEAHGEDDALADAAGERLGRAEELLYRLQNRDYAAYREAFEQRVRTAADELRRTRHLPELVEVRVRWVDWPHRGDATGAQEAWGTVEYELWEIAREQTPPPGFTEPLAEIRGPRTPGDILCATGRMPHQRIPELANYADLSTDAATGLATEPDTESATEQSDPPAGPAGPADPADLGTEGER